jgi:pyruvate formate lyase activating enzyme
MSGPPNTSAGDLLRAAEIGKKNGLRYIYAGNLPGRVGDLEDTKCQECGELLIKRYGYFIQDYRLTPEGSCPRCKSPLPGRWAAKFGGQITDRPFSPHRRSDFVTISN